jgi:hypothetical protein
MPRAFCSSNVKGGRPFVKAPESAGHLSGGIEYPHPIEVPFSPKGELFLGGSLRARHCLGPTGHTTGARSTLHAPSFGTSPIGLAGKLP